MPIFWPSYNIQTEGRLMFGKSSVTVPSQKQTNPPKTTQKTLLFYPLPAN